MCLLFESIKVVDGIPRHLTLHTDRVNRSRSSLFGSTDTIDLSDIVGPVVHDSSGVCKCRVVYDRGIRSVECLPYEQRLITSLVVVHDDTIVYDHKFLDRTALEKYPTVGTTEEVLIVRRGLVTDTRFSNVVFSAGDEWITPGAPLLRGVQREYLLAIGAIRPADIRLADLDRIQKVVLINAMMEIGAGPKIDVGNIRLPAA
jgi:4-amino-4-deoxychorismate lyase